MLPLHVVDVQQQRIVNTSAQFACLFVGVFGCNNNALKSPVQLYLICLEYNHSAALELTSLSILSKSPQKVLHIELQNLWKANESRSNDIVVIIFVFAVIWILSNLRHKLPHPGGLQQ